MRKLRTVFIGISSFLTLVNPVFGTETSSKQQQSLGSMGQAYFCIMTTERRDYYPLNLIDAHNNCIDNLKAVPKLTLLANRYACDAAFKGNFKHPATNTKSDVSALDDCKKANKLSADAINKFKADAAWQSWPIKTTNAPRFDAWSARNCKHYIEGLCFNVRAKKHRPVREQETGTTAHSIWFGKLKLELKQVSGAPYTNTKIPNRLQATFWTSSYGASLTTDRKRGRIRNWRLFFSHNSKNWLLAFSTKNKRELALAKSLIFDGLRKCAETHLLIFCDIESLFSAAYRRHLTLGHDRAMSEKAVSAYKASVLQK